MTQRKTPRRAPSSRLLLAARDVPFRDKTALNALVRDVRSPADLAPAFLEVFHRNPADARRLAASFAESIADPMQHRALFQQAVTMTVDERKTLISGYRLAEQGRGVVHAIGQLPRAQGRVLMHDLIRRSDDTFDRKALRDVLHWMRDAAAEMARLQQRQPPAAPQTDGAVADFFEDVSDDLTGRISAVVDAVVSEAKSLGEAIEDAVDWAANDLANLVQAVREAGRTVGEILEAGIEHGPEFLKKIVKALDDVGVGLWVLLEQTFALPADALVKVLRALSALGRTTRELLEWMGERTYEIVRRGVQALLLIGRTLDDLLFHAFSIGGTILRDLVRALQELGYGVVTILKKAMSAAMAVFDAVVAVLLQLGRKLANLLNEVLAAGLDFLTEVVRAAARAGHALIDFTKYLVAAVAEVAAATLAGLLAGGILFVDVIETIATHAFRSIRYAVEAFFALGKSVLSLLGDTLRLTMRLLKEVIKAAFALGRAIGEFAHAVVEFSTRVAARMIEAAVAVGKTIGEVLEAVAESDAFHYIVMAVMEAFGPVGDVLSWLVDRGIDLTSPLWRKAVLAIRFVKKGIVEIPDWARRQSEAVFARIVELCVDVGAALNEVLDAAIALGEETIELLGAIWERTGNEIDYALNYLEKDFVPGIAKFVKGALKAGVEAGRFLLWTLGKAAEVALEVVRGALDAGVALAELVLATAKHPTEIRQNLLRAARSLGQTWKQVVDAFQKGGEEFMRELVRAAKATGEDLREMLAAVAEVAAGYLDTVIIALMDFLNGFRHLTDAERADAELVFADSVDLDKTFIARDSPTNDVIFWIQDHCTHNQESRAFVTGNLINFDADDGPIERFQFIHEMTHVWQNQNVGPIYLAHAVFGQATAGYNYGYVENVGDVALGNADYDGNTLTVNRGWVSGEGGDVELNATDDFFTFNPEQQGQIMMHYFTRRELLSQPATDYAPWQKFVDFVQTHKNVA